MYDNVIYERATIGICVICGYRSKATMDILTKMLQYDHHVIWSLQTRQKQNCICPAYLYLYLDHNVCAGMDLYRRYTGFRLQVKGQASAMLSKSKPSDQCLT